MRIILARPSQVLYHITNSGALANILESDRFEMKPSDGTGVERELTPEAYYFSCARSKTSAYFQRNASHASAILVLDGAKLSHRYKARPINYWGDMQHMTDSDSGVNNDEMEDRIFSSKPFITGAKSYITEIHLMRDLTPSNPEWYNARIYEVYKAAKLARIPIYMYGFTDIEYEKNNKNEFFLPTEERKRIRENKPSRIAQKNFLLLNKAKADPDVKVRELFESVVRKPKGPIGDYERLKAVEPKMNNGIAPYIFLYNVPVDGVDRKDMGEYIKSKGGEVAYKAFYDLLYYPRDVPTRIANNIHNDRSQPYGKPTKVRENIDTLVQIMRKEKVDPKGFADLLRKKFGLDQR